MENKNIIDKLIEKLSELEEGKYNNNKGISIDIVDEPKKGYIYAIIKKNNKEINISSDGIDQGFNNQIDENSCLYYNEKRAGNVYAFVSVNKNNKHYSVYENGISGDDIPYCYVNFENKLLYKVNDNHYLEYDFNNNKINLYYKKYNSISSENLEKDYVKFRYHDFFTNDIEIYNFIIDKRINAIKEEFKTSIYDELVNSLSVPKLDCKNISEEVKTLLELADIYKTYRDKFDLKLYESVLNEVYNYVVSLINEPVQSNINNIQNMIQNIDVTNKEELIRLRTELDKVLEPDKKTKKLRKKK